MSFSVNKVKNKPIVILTLHEDHDTEKELHDSAQATIHKLEAASEDRLFLIVDFKVTLTMNDILLGASAAARGENPLWHHDKVKEVLVVTKDFVTKVAAEGMQHSTFGNANVKVFETLNQALSYAQSSQSSV